MNPRSVAELGSIPAGAGNPTHGSQISSSPGVHPRGCGESVITGTIVSQAAGPSPRVRGIRPPGRPPPAGAGSIPAGAGNPASSGAAGCIRTVHPRGCGESGDCRGANVATRGPSPRVRGIPRDPGGGEQAERSIPAGAGNPRCAGSTAGATRVHPRGCGESSELAEALDGYEGPSPRVRGIHAGGLSAGAEPGSIPAGAGNPASSAAGRRDSRVHPRGCGESVAVGRAPDCDQGPSPRVRGIRPDGGAGLEAYGSIPAGAGNPWSRRPRASRRKVHPRGCGESLALAAGGSAAGGPSPRVRGIPAAIGPQPAARRSIPAGAGNPRTPAPRRRRPEVHPRGCGESVSSIGDRLDAQGPSPRVRGIPAGRGTAPTGSGSIPAGAGNPRSLGRCTAGKPVHPRGCGESAQPRSVNVRADGPSPRVRGILHWVAGLCPAKRSIPAGAGNPCRPMIRARPRQVHPRGCGESVGRRRRRPARVGPSPRVRGIPSNSSPPGP